MLVRLVQNWHSNCHLFFLNLWIPELPVLYNYLDQTSQLRILPGRQHIEPWNERLIPRRVVFSPRVIIPAVICRPTVFVIIIHLNFVYWWYIKISHCDVSYFNNKNCFDIHVLFFNKFIHNKHELYSTSPLDHTHW
jgi:hypothetical protein